MNLNLKILFCFVVANFLVSVSDTDDQNNTDGRIEAVRRRTENLIEAAISSSPNPQFLRDLVDAARNLGKLERELEELQRVGAN